MGLKERRKMEELKTATFPGRVKEIEELEMKCAYALRTDGMFSDNEICQLLTHKL